MIRPNPRSSLFPYTTLFRSSVTSAKKRILDEPTSSPRSEKPPTPRRCSTWCFSELPRSEEHTSELQSHVNLVCRLRLEKKKNSHVSQTTAMIGEITGGLRVE